MKIEFSQPRFTGARFNEHTLPVDVARDLGAYETLIIELAKHLYLKDNPNRQRVPKGFSTNFRLDIDRIDEGCAQPALVIPVSLELPQGYHNYFSRARDLVAECVAAPKDALPENFPKDLLVHFNQLGRSLRDDETMELQLHDKSDVAKLTPEKRKQLVLSVDKVYERELTLMGYIEAADFEKNSNTFRLRLDDGKQFTVPMPNWFHDKARHFNGLTRHKICVHGVGEYSSQDNLLKVIIANSIDIFQNHEIATRLDEISQLNDGWFEGSGLALNSDKLLVISEMLIFNYPNKLPIPQIVPTQDGNLLLEWEAEGYPSLDIDLKRMKANFHAFGDDDQDIERVFNLEDPKSESDKLFAFLNESIKDRSL